MTKITYNSQYFNSLTSIFRYPSLTITSDLEVLRSASSFSHFTHSYLVLNSKSSITDSVIMKNQGAESCAGIRNSYIISIRQSKHKNNNSITVE